MRIRYKLALLFTLIVAGLLTLFSYVIYEDSSHHRDEIFLGRLENKARTTARYLIDVEEINNELLRIIDQNSLTSLDSELVLVFDPGNKLVYSSVDDKPVKYSRKLIAEVREEKIVEYTDGLYDQIGLAFPSKINSSKGEYVVLASAYDRFGKDKLRNLRNTLIICWVVGVSLTVLASGWLSAYFLRPVATINEKIQLITAQNLKERLSEGNGRDEIAQLAINFNQMLNRLDMSFEQQKSFVSHASHELRTPLTAMKTDIQSGLEETLSAEEYRDILRDLFQDTQRLIGLTNGLLQLARPLDKVLKRNTLSVVDLLLDIQSHMSSAQKPNSIRFDPAIFDLKPQDVQVTGNESLLKTLLTNLMDNACKYSDGRPVDISIERQQSDCCIHVADQGIGIAPKDQERIFGAFFRGNNAIRYSGYGIGLAVSQRIAEWHEGSISVQSNLHQGSTFTLRLPLA